MNHIDKLAGGMFALILVFILVSRASDTTSVINAIGGAITKQTQALQGVGGFGTSLVK